MTLILNNLAGAVVQRVPQKQVVLPADESRLWAEAGHIARMHFGIQGEMAWFNASQWLTAVLEQGVDLKA